MRQPSRPERVRSRTAPAPRSRRGSRARAATAGRRIVERPVVAAETGNDGALVAAAHRDQPASPRARARRSAARASRRTGRSPPRASPPRTSGCTRARRARSGRDGAREARVDHAVEEGCRHLRAAGVLDAGEDHRLHPSPILRQAASRAAPGRGRFAAPRSSRAKKPVASAAPASCAAMNAGTSCRPDPGERVRRGARERHRRIRERRGRGEPVGGRDVGADGEGSGIRPSTRAAEDHGEQPEGGHDLAECLRRPSASMGRHREQRLAEHQVRAENAGEGARKLCRHVAGGVSPGDRSARRVRERDDRIEVCARDRAEG